MDRAGRERAGHDAQTPARGHDAPDERGIGGRRIGIHLHRREDAGAGPHLAHERMAREGLQRVGEPPLELLGSLEQVLLLDDVQVRHRGGRHARMAGVGVSVPPHARVLRPERLPHAGRGEDRPQGEVAAGDPLRAGDEVGLEPPAPAREPRSRAPEPGDDLVDHEQHAGLPADISDRVQVPVWGGEDAARADHRLAEERGDAIGAQFADRLPQRLGVVPRHLHDIAEQRPVAGEVGRDAGQRGSGRVHAVVRAVAMDQRRALRPSHEAPVPTRHLRGRVDGVRSPARQEHLGAGNGCDVGHPLDELLNRWIREVLERGVGLQDPHLPGDGIGDLAAPVAHVAVPEAGGRIQISAPVRVPDVVSLAPHDRQLPGRLDRRHVREGVPGARHGASFPPAVAGSTAGPPGAVSTGIAGTHPASRPSTLAGFTLVILSRNS
jgi:hypothetical protein